MGSTFTVQQIPCGNVINSEIVCYVAAHAVYLVVPSQRCCFLLNYFAVVVEEQYYTFVLAST